VIALPRGHQEDFTAGEIAKCHDRAASLNRRRINRCQQWEQSMKFRTLAAAAALAALGAGAVVAADEPQVVRQEMMKKVGGAMGALAGIAKGEKPYDAEVVKTSLTTMSEVAKAFPEQFPEGSESGHETEASPKIWETMDDFKARSAKLGTDADAVLASMPADQAAVGAALKTIGGNCGGCHEVYRVKK
jgi:cytochrome c556